MLFEMARMASEDGLVMTLHPAAFRNHHTPTFEEVRGRCGRRHPHERGGDALPASDARGVRHRKDPTFRVVVFTMDETIVRSRRLGPLAGFYPSLFVGVPWWFIEVLN